MEPGPSVIIALKTLKIGKKANLKKFRFGPGGPGPKNTFFGSLIPDPTVYNEYGSQPYTHTRTVQVCAVYIVKCTLSFNKSRQFVLQHR